MTRHELHNLAEKYYGDDWKRELAKALQIDERTIRRWMSGATPIREATAIAIRALVSKSL